MFDYILPIYFVILYNTTGQSHLNVADCWCKCLWASLQSCMIGYYLTACYKLWCKMPVILWTFGGGRCAVTELRHLSLCHCVTVCVCVCPLHAAQGLATSRTVLRHPAGAPHVMDCYLCGREFDTRILNNHEDECIKHWRKWNNSLPVDQRQPEPERPEFKFNKGHLYFLT